MGHKRSKQAGLAEAEPSKSKAGSRDLRFTARVFRILHESSPQATPCGARWGRFRQCLDLYRRLGDKMGVAGTVRFLGQLSYGEGDYDAAVRLLEECLALERELGSVQRVAEALGFLGAIAQAARRVAEARTLYVESLSTYAEAGNPAGADVSCIGSWPWSQYRAASRRSAADSRYACRRRWDSLGPTTGSTVISLPKTPLAVRVPRLRGGEEAVLYAVRAPRTPTPSL